MIHYKKRAFLSQTNMYNNLVSWYLLNGDGSDNWLNKTISLTGTANFNGAGRHSTKCYSNNGSVGYGSTSLVLPQSNILTWSFWFNLTSLPATSSLYFFLSTAQYRASNLAIRVDSSGNLQAQLEYNGSADATLISNVSINTWYHVAVTIDSNKILRSYLNGALVNTYNIIAGWMSTSSTLYLGKYISSTNSYCLNGRIDDLRIYNTDLSDSEINKLYYLEL